MSEESTESIWKKSLETVPQYLYSHGRSYNYGWCDDHGIVAGLKAAKANPGSAVTFIVADHHAQGDKIYVTVPVGYSTKLDSFRFAGERNDPDSAGSHRLGGSLEEAIARLAMNLGSHLGEHGGVVYRVRDKKDPGFETELG